MKTNTIAALSRGQALGSERTRDALVSPLGLGAAVLAGLAACAVAHDFPGFIDLVRAWALFNLGMPFIQ